MLESPRKAYVLIGVEPELDCNDPRLAAAAMGAAEMVVALSAYRGKALECASVLLPISPFTETSGSFVSTEGRLQSFNGVVRPAGDARPAWKVLRVLGNLLGLKGFEYDSSEAVREDACVAGSIAARLDNRVPGLALLPLSAQATPGGLQRIADVPIYFADPIVRRAASLQQTRDARDPCASMNAATIARLGLAAGAKLRITQSGGEARLELACDNGLPADCVRVAAAHASTAGLGGMSGELGVERS
jgi:NADH-quinone oxidoreductase subunit G